MFETSQIYQDSHSEDAYYFVEVPYMDLEKFHEFCLTYSICPNLSLKYFSLEEILSDTPSLKIYKSFKDLFTPSLVSHIEKYIINSEPIPIKAHYAVVCILTTPTNYRTMGLLGSYYKKFGEQWKFYRFPLEEPTELDLKDLDGKRFLRY